MRKINVTLVTLFFVASICPLASALSVGPIEPVGNLKWSLSAEDNYTINRDLEITGTLTKAETKNINQAYAKFTIGLGEYFNLYGKIGASTGSKYSFTDAGTNIDYETDTSLFWGVGGTGTYKFAQTWKLIGDIQYNAWDENVDKATYGGTAGSGITNPGIENQEFQATALVAKDFTLGTGTVLTPYVGMAYVYYKTETEGTITYTVPTGTVTNNWSLEGNDSVSAIVGLKAKLNNNWNGYIEGRFIAENAVSGGLSYNF